MKIKLTEHKICTLIVNVKRNAWKNILKIRPSNGCIQFVDKKCIASKTHLLSAIYHAIRSHERKKNMSKNLCMEVMLYLAGVRQIEDAIDKCGINENTRVVVAICIDANIYEISEKIKKFGEILDDEICNREDSESLEATAMLDIFK